LLFENRGLRDGFQAYLNSSAVTQKGPVSNYKEVLRLWCLAEDYRKGHPASLEPYPILQVVQKRPLDESFIKDWAQNIITVWGSVPGLNSAVPDLTVTSVQPNIFRSMQSETWKLLSDLVLDYCKSSYIYRHIVFKLLKESTKVSKSL
jgi:hypothetical protein